MKNINDITCLGKLADNYERWQKWTHNRNGNIQAIRQTKVSGVDKGVMKAYFQMKFLALKYVDKISSDLFAVL